MFDGTYYYIPLKHKGKENMAIVPPPPPPSRKGKKIMAKDPVNKNDTNDLLITADMTAEQLKKRFNERTASDRLDLYGFEKCCQKLTKIIQSFQEIGIDISLRVLSYTEKSKLFPQNQKAKGGSSSEKAEKAQKLHKQANEFISGNQLSLVIYDREYLIMPIHEDSFYFRNGVINKEFSSPPNPNIDELDKGSVYAFDETDTMEVFLETIMSTASLCASVKEICDENNIQLYNSKNIPSPPLAKPKKMSQDPFKNKS